MRVNEEFLNPFTKKEIIDEFISKSKRLYIHSPMGSGKSNIVKSVLSYNKRVLMITNRVSLSVEFKERYKDFAIIHYKDEIIPQKSLIIQYDSLHKVNLNDYDIFILDEFISILFHSQSLLTNNALFNLTKLNIILESKKVLILDAFLNLLDYQNSLKIVNEFRENTEINIFKNKNYFIKDLLECAKNENISVSCSNLLTAKALFLELKKNDINAFLFSSETPEAKRGEILSFLKEATPKFKCFIFTPSITTGIDILSNYSIHYHLDESNSVDVVSSIQMIKRNRKAKKINCYVEKCFKILEVDENKLNSSIEKELSKNKIRNPFLVEIDYTTGNYTLSKTGRFFNKITALKNCLEINHRKAFLELLEFQFKNIKYSDSIFKENLIESNIKEILNKNYAIIDSLESTNDLNAYATDKFNQRKVLLENHILEVFNNKISLEKIKYFLKNPKMFKFAKNKELFKRSLSELEKYKNLKISKFDFNLKDIDLLIEYKRKNFKLQKLYYIKDLSKKDLNFLTLIGYDRKSNKLFSK